MAPPPAPSAPLRHSAAAERNKAVILTELLRRLPAQGEALEIASGTGQHVVHFAAALPGWRWQPTDLDPGALDSITARVADTGLRNIRPVQRLDLLDPADHARWSARVTGAVETPAAAHDLLYTANLLHIAPWAVCAALMRLAAARLNEGGRLVIYGPFREDGTALADSNRAFDDELRQRHSAWGLRWLHDVDAEATAAGLQRIDRVEMPANNLLLVYAVAPAGPTHRVRLTPSGAEFPAPPGTTVLAAALAAGWRLPHSCRNGTCRACLCRLEHGSVRYLVPWPGVDADERAEGWTLPCVAVPGSDVVLQADRARPWVPP